MKVLLSIVVVILFAGGSSFAQTPRKTPKPLATPPILTGAEIISRAGLEPEPTPVEQPVETSPETAPAKTVRERISTTSRVSYDDRQKRLLLNLDILTRAEQRTESLRKQLFEMTEKENALRMRIDQIDLDMRPEMIERSSQLAGSLRPEEIRENRRKTLLAEKTNLQSLLTDVQTAKAGLTINLQRAETMVEKLRVKLEKDIDNALLDDEPEDQP